MKNPNLLNLKHRVRNLNSKKKLLESKKNELVKLQCETEKLMAAMKVNDMPQETMELLSNRFPEVISLNKRITKALGSSNKVSQQLYQIEKRLNEASEIFKHNNNYQKLMDLALTAIQELQEIVTFSVDTDADFIKIQAMEIIQKANLIFTGETSTNQSIVLNRTKDIIKWINGIINARIKISTNADDTNKKIGSYEENIEQFGIINLWLERLKNNLPFSLEPNLNSINSAIALVIQEKIELQSLLLETKNAAINQNICMSSINKYNINHCQKVIDLVNIINTKINFLNNENTSINSDYLQSLKHNVLTDYKEIINTLKPTTYNDGFLGVFIMKDLQYFITFFKRIIDKIHHIKTYNDPDTVRNINLIKDEIILDFDETNTILKIMRKETNNFISQLKELFKTIEKYSESFTSIQKLKIELFTYELKDFLEKHTKDLSADIQKDIKDFLIYVSNIEVKSAIHSVHNNCDEKINSIQSITNSSLVFNNSDLFERVEQLKNLANNKEFSTSEIMQDVLRVLNIKFLSLANKAHSQIDNFKSHVTQVENQQKRWLLLISDEINISQKILATEKYNLKLLQDDFDKYNSLINHLDAYKSKSLFSQEFIVIINACRENLVATKKMIDAIFTRVYAVLGEKLINVQEEVHSLPTLSYIKKSFEHTYSTLELPTDSNGLYRMREYFYIQRDFLSNHPDDFLSAQQKNDLYASRKILNAIVYKIDDAINLKDNDSKNDKSRRTKSP
jgi:hypothetical protein